MTSHEINGRLASITAVTQEIETYTIVKVLSVNQSSADFKDLVNRTLLNLKPEVAYVEPPLYSEDCQGYYNYIYRKQDTKGDGFGDTRFDENGDIIQESDLNALIQSKCAGTAQEESTTSNYCTGLFQNILDDVSPGGQYFDNTPDQFKYNSTGDLVENADYDKDQWLRYQMYFMGYAFTDASNASDIDFVDYDPSVHELRDIRNLLFQNFDLEGYFNLSDINEFNFDLLRDNWKPEFALFFAPLHPEFKAVYYNCGIEIKQRYADTYTALQSEGQTGIFGGEMNILSLNLHTTNSFGDIALNDVLMPTNITHRNWVDGFNSALNETVAIDQGYYDPLQLGTGDVDPSLLGVNTSNGEDPFFEALGNTDALYIKVKTFLREFVKLDATNYLSIYDVLAANFNESAFNTTYNSGDIIYELSEIEALRSNCTTNQCREDMVMAVYHYSNIGVFSRLPSKFDFFRSTYRTYRDFAIYEYYKRLDSKVATDDGFASINGGFNYIQYANHFLPSSGVGESSGLMSIPQEGYTGCQSVGSRPVYILKYHDYPGTPPGGQGVDMCELGDVKNIITQNLDGSISDLYVMNHNGANTLYTTGQSQQLTLAADGVDGDVYHDPTESQILKVNNGFAFHLPKNEMFEALGAGADMDAIQDLFEGLIEDQIGNIAAEWDEACEKNATRYAHYLLIDDERNGSNILGTTTMENMVEAMDAFCNTQQGAYFSKTDLQTHLNSYTSYFTGYTVYLPIPYSVFNGLEANTSALSEDYTVTYNHVANRLKDLDCGCDNFKTEAESILGGPVVVANLSNAQLDQLAEFYNTNDLVVLPTTADETAFRSHLGNWKTVCGKNKRYPEDFYDLVFDSYTLAYNPATTLTQPFEDFVTQYTNTNNSITKAFELFSCYEQVDDNPLVTVVKEVNAEILSDSKSEFFRIQDAKHLNYREDYQNHCLGVQENLTFNLKLQEYQYTLFYYDAAGNLISTIPPEGVHILPKTAPVAQPKLSDVQAFRDGTNTTPTYPPHRFKTTYTYNSLNQLAEQVTPDGGKTEFWYDQLGRVILSQDKRQADIDRYSFSLYDDLGRVYFSGELASSAEPTAANLNTVGGNTSAFATWTGTKTRYDITRTYYDKPTSLNSIENAFGSLGQQNLRGRVAYIRYTDYAYPDGVLPPNQYGQVPDRKYSSGLYYSYDAHGNVKRLVTTFNHYALGEDVKVVDYEYDLVSGNVLKVNYQEGHNDQFFHKYSYDADNRIQHVYTSNDGVIWRQDAKYNYYMHGPLKRIELGASQVQGLDYAYTLQGWLKGVNGKNDLGLDGIGASGNANQNFGRDKFAYTLNYFNGDYSSQNSAFALGVPTSINDANTRELYNGNINAMYTKIDFQDQSLAKESMTYYGYDQLQRIKSSNALNMADYNLAALSETGYSYDKNGNLETLKRKKNGQTYDDLGYQYQGGTNKLQAVDNLVSSSTSDSYYGNNAFTYDGSGNLITESASQISRITWTPSGKVRTITYENGCTGNNCDDIEFVYDAMGNRIFKIVKTPSNGGVESASNWKYYRYALDASGNPMATYKWEILGDPSGYMVSKSVADLMLYGSDRLGTTGKGELSTEITSVNVAESTPQGWELEQPTISGFNSSFNLTDAIVQSPIGPNVSVNMISAGDIKFNLDRSFSGSVKFFTGNEIKMLDVQMSSFNILSGSGQIDKGTHTIQANSVVELTPSGEILDVIASTTSGINISLLDPNVFNATTNVVLAAEPNIINVNFIDYLATNGDLFAYQDGLDIGYKNFELKNHLGNVLAVVSDLKTDDATAYMTSGSDYLPFGMQMPGRKFDTDGYRYGFQGQEKDDEVKGEGNSVNYKFRMHDPRLGRFFAVDPLTSKYPHYSPYSFGGNKVIQYVELEGLEEKRSAAQDPNYGLTMAIDNAQSGIFINYSAIKVVDPNKFVIPNTPPTRATIGRTKHDMYVEQQVKNTDMALGFVVPGYDIAKKYSKGEEITALDVGLEAAGSAGDAFKFVLKGAVALKALDEVADVVRATDNLISTSKIKWKGFSKGKLSPHWEKHGHEFGNITQNEYLSKAKDFAKETGDFQEEVIGNFVIKYDDSTRRVLVGHAKKREIRTFYKADDRTTTPFKDAIQLAKDLSKK